MIIIAAIIFSLFLVDADFVNGFDYQTGIVREGGIVSITYVGGIRCEDQGSCSFKMQAMAPNGIIIETWITLYDMSEVKTNISSSIGINPLPGSALSIYTIYYALSSEGWMTWRNTSVPCKNCTFFPGDYDGDGGSDLLGFSNEEKQGYFALSSNGYTWQNFAIPPCPAQSLSCNLMPITGDFDGDNKSDFIAYDSSGMLYYVLSSEGYGVWRSGNTPCKNCTFISGDYNGDNLSDFVGYNQESKTIQFALSPDWVWGSASMDFCINCTFFPGDYNGDGISDFLGLSIVEKKMYYNLAPFNLGWGNFPIDLCSGEENCNILPVSGDFDGDKQTDILAYNPLTGNGFFSLSSLFYSNLDEFSTPCKNCTPISGDYDGDKVSDLMLYSTTTLLGCTPNCTEKTCGDDGCGGSCGNCTTGQTCASGSCVTIACNAPIVGNDTSLLKILFVKLGDAPYYTQLVNDSIYNQLKVISPFKEKFNSIAFYSINISINESFNCNAFTGSSGGSGFACNNTKIYESIEEKCDFGNLKGMIIVVIVETESGGSGGEIIYLGSSLMRDLPIQFDISKNVVIHEIGHNFGLGDLYYGTLYYNGDPSSFYGTEFSRKFLNVDGPGCSKWCNSYKPVSQYNESVSSKCLKFMNRSDCVSYGRSSSGDCFYSSSSAPDCCVWSHDTFEYFDTNCVPAIGSENIGVGCLEDSGCYYGAMYGNYAWRPVLSNDESIMYGATSDRFDSVSVREINKIFKCCLSPAFSSDECENFRIEYSNFLKNYNWKKRIGSCGVIEDIAN